MNSKASERIHPDNHILLTDENGKKEDFLLADVITLHDEEYAILLTAQDRQRLEQGEISKDAVDAGETLGNAEDSPEVVIMQIREDPEDPEMDLYVPVEDEEVLEEAFQTFLEENKDLYP